MVRIRRWVVGKRKKVVWSEPQLPPFVKINPESPPGLGEGIQPGDISMGMAAEEFLNMDEGEDEPVLASVLRCLAWRLAQLCPDGFQRQANVLDRVRVGKSQETLAARAEGGTGQGRHPCVLQQPGLQIG